MTAKKTPVSTPAEKKARLDRKIRASIVPDDEHAAALAMQTKVYYEVRALIKDSAIGYPTKPEAGGAFTTHPLNGCDLYIIDGVIMKRTYPEASAENCVITLGDVGCLVKDVLARDPGRKLIPCTEADMWQLWARWLNGQAFQKRSALSSAQALLRSKDVSRLEKYRRDADARYARAIEDARKTLPATLKKVELARTVSKDATLVYQKAQRKVLAARKAEEKARRLKNAPATPSPSDEVLKMLREARDTIDSLPGYPKGAELCDKIDAFFGEGKSAKKPARQIAPLDKKDPHAKH